MEAKKIIVDIEINSEDIKKSTDAMGNAAKEAAVLTAKLNELKTEQQANAKAAKAGAISATELASRQAGLKLKMTETSKALAASNKDYANNKIVVDAAKGSNEQLRARLALQTKAYNGLSKAQRENTKGGKQMEANIKALTDKLKANEKAVGDNRRNVGNYEDALKGAAGGINVMGVNLGSAIGKLTSFKDGIVAQAAATKASAVATGGFSGALKVLKFALISTGIGAIVVAFGSLISFLTQTKRGSEALSQAMSGLGAIVSVLTDRASALGEGIMEAFSNPKKALKDLGELIKSQIVNRFTAIPAMLTAVGKGFKALAERDLEGMKSAAEDAARAVIQLNTGLDPEQQKKIAAGIKGVASEIVNEAAEAAKLDKRMQELRDSERELLVETSKRKAEVASLQLIAEDETNSMKKRGEAIAKANKIQEGTMASELALQKERVSIFEQQLELGENMEEDEQKLAEERAKLGDIEAGNIKKLRTLKAKENSIRNQSHALQVKQANEKKKLSENEIKAIAEREVAITKGFEDERALIDEAAEFEKNNAIISISNAEERAEKIAYIERELLLEKIRSIDDETAAYTASADMVGAVDEVKYAKQLAQRVKLEAEIVNIDTTARAKEFTDKVASLALDEKLDNEAAELSIDNERDLTQRKGVIALGYLTQKLELMRALAEADDLLTENEIKNLQLVENKIKIIQEGLDNPEAKTLGQSIGLGDEDLSKIQEGLELATQAIQTIQMVVDANAEIRLNEIDERNTAEIRAIESSTLSEEKKDAKIKAINKKAAQEKYAIELQQFKTAKALAIIMAIVNTATAVMAQLSNPVPFTGFVLAALAAVTGAVQIGVIASQKPPPPPKFAKGGVLKGASHAEGGIQMYGNGQHYGEAEGGEIVLTKGVNANPRLRAEASRLNVLGGGNPLGASNYMADGGIVSPTFAARQSARGTSMSKQDFADVIADMPSPSVQVSEINRVQGQVVRVSETSDL